MYHIKKCFVALLIPLFALAFWACDGGNGSAPKIASYEITPFRTSIVIRVVVENGKNVAKDSMKLKIFEGDSETVKNSWTVKEKITTEQTFTFSSLKVDQEYTITLSATFNQRDNELKKDITRTSLLGSADEPKEINNMEDFMNLPDDLSAHYILKTDIDFLVDADDSEQSEKIKKVIDPLFTSEFNGQIDGNNHTVSNFKITVSRNHMGLFGNLGRKAVIKNLNIENAELDIARVINGNIGIVAGWNQGLIENVNVKSSSIKYATSATSNLFAGGFVGLNAGTIKNSSIVSSTMNIMGGTFSCIGGFVGYNQSPAVNNALIESSYSDVIITGGTSTSSRTELDIKLHLGGFVGNNSGTITDSYSKGEIQDIKAECPNVELEKEVEKFIVSIGGFVGSNTGKIFASASTVAITSFKGQRVIDVRFGGFCGYNGATGVIDTAAYIPSEASITSLLVSSVLASDPTHFNHFVGLDNFTYTQENPLSIYAVEGLKYVINEDSTFIIPIGAHTLARTNLAETLINLGFSSDVVSAVAP